MSGDLIAKGATLDCEAYDPTAHDLIPALQSLKRGQVRTEFMPLTYIRHPQWANIAQPLLLA